jgi:hypothetical protein
MFGAVEEIGESSLAHPEAHRDSSKGFARGHRREKQPVPFTGRQELKFLNGFSLQRLASHVTSKATAKRR